MQNHHAKSSLQNSSSMAIVPSLIYQKAMEATTGAPRRKIFSTTALHNLLLIVSRMSLQRSIRFQLCSTILNPIWPRGAAHCFKSFLEGSGHTNFTNPFEYDKSLQGK